MHIVALLMIMVHLLKLQMLVLLLLDLLLQLELLLVCQHLIVVVVVFGARRSRLSVLMVHISARIGTRRDVALVGGGSTTTTTSHVLDGTALEIQISIVGGGSLGICTLFEHLLFLSVPLLWITASSHGFIDCPAASSTSSSSVDSHYMPYLDLSLHHFLVLVCVLMIVMVMVMVLVLVLVLVMEIRCSSYVTLFDFGDGARIVHIV